MQFGCTSRLVQHSAILWGHCYPAVKCDVCVRRKMYNELVCAWDVRCIWLPVIVSQQYWVYLSRPWHVLVMNCECISAYSFSLALKTSKGLTCWHGTQGWHGSYNPTWVASWAPWPGDSIVPCLPETCRVLCEAKFSMDKPVRFLFNQLFLPF